MTRAEQRMPNDGLNEEPIPAARPAIGEAEIEAAVRVLRSGMFVQGPEVAAFEQEFAALVDGRHCVAVNSGTSALHLALMALGFGPGDEVIVPSFSFAATANAVRLVGAEPVFADIEPGSFCLDPRAVEAAIGPAHRGDHAGPPVRAPGRHGPADADRPAARPRDGRGCRPGARRDPARHPGGRLRRRGLLQLLPHEEHAHP